MKALLHAPATDGISVSRVVEHVDLRCVSFSATTFALWLHLPTRETPGSPHELIPTTTSHRRRSKQEPRFLLLRLRILMRLRYFPIEKTATARRLRQRRLRQQPPLPHPTLPLPPPTATTSTTTTEGNENKR